MRRMLRLSPMPTASEAMRTSYPVFSPLKRRACCVRVSGGSAPYTTQHLCGVTSSIMCFNA